MEVDEKKTRVNAFQLLESVFYEEVVKETSVAVAKKPRSGRRRVNGLLRRAEEYWEESEEHEFKALFLTISLHLVLTPTQGARLAADVVLRYVIFYLDRLNRDPILWGQYPRIKMWNMEQIRVASNADRFLPNGDYGKLGCLDVAYGEWHPREARDVPLPQPFYVEKVNGASIRGGGRRQRAEREEQEESRKRQRLCEREAQSVNPYSQGKSCMGKLRKWSCKGELRSSQMCNVNFVVHVGQKGAIGSSVRKEKMREKRSDFVRGNVSSICGEEM
ncbi:Superoxide-generating NADPH oxidase heavy chain subunit B [Bienertia sinuspersici]